MRTISKTLLTSMLLVQWATSGAQGADYQLDDDSISTALNASEGTEPRDNWFGNVFTAQVGANLITEVSFGVFTTTPGSSASVVLYSVTDPGGNPALGATRLYTQAFTPLTGDGTNAFLQSITLTSPVTINTGDRFLVAVFIPNVIASPPNDVYPYLLDDSGAAAGSYWDRSAPNTFNLDNLSLAKLVNQPLVPGGFAPGDGHVIIRATGGPSSTNLPPVARCKNLVVPADANCQGNGSVNDGSSDPDSDPINIVQTPAGPYPLGTNMVTLTVDDGKATNSCTATVTVVDTTPPAIPVLEDVTGECSATITNAPTTTDNCAGILTGTTSDPLTRTNQGTSEVTWAFDDGHGHIVTATQKIVVRDTTPPVITCPGDLVVANDSGLCSAVVNFDFSAIDNCEVTNLVAEPPSGSIFPTGTNTVVVTATDEASNTITCTFTVTVLNGEAPRVSCRPAPNPSGKIPVAGKNGDAGVNPSGYYQVLAKDACDSQPAIYIKDTASAFVAGPFQNGDIVRVKHTGGVPSSVPGNAPVVAVLSLRGNGLAIAVNAGGDVTPDASGCLLPVSLNQ